jgi:signal transduction histidine kinase
MTPNAQAAGLGESRGGCPFTQLSRQGGTRLTCLGRVLRREARGQSSSCRTAPSGYGRPAWTRQAGHVERLRTRDVSRRIRLPRFVVAVGSSALALGSSGLTSLTSLTRARCTTGDGFDEALGLVHHLRQLTDELPTGLDPAIAAERLLQSCADLVPVRTGAVLRRAADKRLVPLALHGARRLPWTRPLEVDGPLGTAWREERPVRETRSGDRSGGRSPSDLLVLPIPGRDHLLGLLVLDSSDPTAFAGPEVVELLLREVAAASVALEVCLVFDEMRQGAIAEERHRLAHEMHDGIAQEVAVLGFRIDMLQSRAQQTHLELVADLAELRSSLDDLSSAVRVSMVDLRSSVTPERGLTTALSGYLLSVASATGLRVHTDLRDSGFRLPGAVEESVYRLVHHCVRPLADCGVEELWVMLDVEPPRARLELYWPGPTPGDALPTWLDGHQSSDLTVTSSTPGANRLEILVGGPR